MRLLNTHNFELVEFLGANIPEYAILSHTWGRDEVTLESLKSGNYSKLAGYQKLENAALRARVDRFDWVWIDSCCIDKTSSAELSEAINSMFEWYARAATCYAYLEDVQYAGGTSNIGVGIRHSRWFTRGWTLQELIAPGEVLFYDGHWGYIARRSDIAIDLETITGIPNYILGHRPRYQDAELHLYCNAERMSWASGRETTRPEDRAYSLLGLFNVNMPLLYGEGSTRSFHRLLEEILKVSSDSSILAGCDSSRVMYYGDLLADSPDDFEACRNLKKATLCHTSPILGENSLSNVALHINAQVLEIAAELNRAGSTYMILPCRPREDVTKVLGLRLMAASSSLFADEAAHEAILYGCAGKSRERTGLLDAHEAVRKSRQRPVVIIKDSHTLNYSVEPRVRHPTHLWLRPSESFQVRSPQIGEVYPSKGWNTSNWTLKLEVPKHGTEYFESTDFSSTYGAAKLERPQICVMFRCTVRWGGHYDFEYSLAHHKEWGITARCDLPTEIVHCLRLDEDEIVTLQLHIDYFQEHKLAILEIDALDNDEFHRRLVGRI